MGSVTVQLPVSIYGAFVRALDGLAASAIPAANAALLHGMSILEQQPSTIVLYSQKMRRQFKKSGQPNNPYKITKLDQNSIQKLERLGDTRGIPGRHKVALECICQFLASHGIIVLEDNDTIVVQEPLTRFPPESGVQT